MNGILLRKGEGTETHSGNWSYAATNQGKPRMAEKYQTEGEKHKTDSLSQTPKEESTQPTA